jgi:lambda family phage tail tape measure protein
VIEGLDVAMVRLKTSLEEIGITVEEIESPMQKTLIDIPKKMTLAMEEATGKLKQWASDARDIWGNLADVAVGALDSMSDSLTDLVLTGKADFASLADSILKDLTKIMIKAMMAQTLGAFMPGLFGGAGAAVAIPTGQHGGDVMKTGLAVIHKGERLSGENDEYGGKQSATLNINVTAIDAAGTAQFLSKNKRQIATMIQSALTSNHSLRRSKGWK